MFSLLDLIRQQGGLSGPQSMLQQMFGAQPMAPPSPMAPMMGGASQVAQGMMGPAAKPRPTSIAPGGPKPGSFKPGGFKPGGFKPGQPKIDPPRRPRTPRMPGMPGQEMPRRRKGGE